MHISSDYKIIKLVHAFAMALQCCPNSLDWITEINKFKKEFGVIVWKVQVPHKVWQSHPEYFSDRKA